MNDTFFIILNPWSGKGAAAKREPMVRTILERLELPYELVRTERPGDATRLARAAAGRNYRAVVAAGGDGTVNEIANGLLGTPMPLSILPIGTGNDFIKMFCSPPLRLRQTIERLRNGTIRAIDVGIVNGRAFVNGMGVGFDAQVAAETAQLKHIHGFAVYIVALLRALRRIRSPEMMVRFNGQTIQRRILLAYVGNGRCQGGGFWITPDAQIDDGLFDLCLIDRLRIDEFVRHVPKVLRGRHTKLRQVTMARAREVVITSSTPLAVHVDGEVIGTDLQHLEVHLQPGALKVLF